MRPATKAVVLIVAIVALYFAALAYGFMRDDSNDASASDPNETKPGIKLLGKWTQPFAPRYEMGSLRCHGRLLTRGPRLSGDKKECVLPIDTSFKDKYRQVVIDVEPEPSEAPFEAYVHAIYEEKDNPRAKRKAERCPLTSEMKADEFRLEVELGLIVDMDGKWDCWLRQDKGRAVRVTLVRRPLPPPPLPPPSLTLRCVGCGGDPARAITLRAEDERD